MERPQRARCARTVHARINLMREHMRPESRVHYTIAAGGDVPNVVPGVCEGVVWLRDAKRSEVESLLARTRLLARGAAEMTETSAEIKVRGGSWEVLLNEAGTRLVDANLRWLGPPVFTEQEQAFAREIQRATACRSSAWPRASSVSRNRPRRAVQPTWVTSAGSHRRST